MKCIAYYLPQFHPIPENDLWWGKDFTEWTNVRKAKPLYNGHDQPRVPAALGYYDLRMPQARTAQAQLAKQYNIAGFCYYHYWFGNGKQLLNRPIDEVIASGEPDFPFCFCWANQTWKGHWFGADNRTLMQQEYPGNNDIENHFQYLVKAFRDKRYIKWEGKPVFQILDIRELPDPSHMATRLKELAVQHGFPGLYLIAGHLVPDNWNPISNHFDAVMDNSFPNALTRATEKWNSWKSGIIYNHLVRFLIGRKRVFKKRRTVTMKDVMKHYRVEQKNYTTIPMVLPNWDNTPRAVEKGLVIREADPVFFEKQLELAAHHLQESKGHPGFVFIRAWNEWAEGNYLEPDSKNGDAYLRVVKKFSTE